MKSLYELYLECCDGCTPANTLGMGNPMPPTDGEFGSEPMSIKSKTKTVDNTKKKIKKRVN